MGLKVASGSLQNILASYSGAQLANFQIGLFVNAATPSETSVIGDFTAATFPGYGLVSNQNFGSATTVGTQAVVTAPPVLWTAGAGTFSETVYGYYILDNIGTYVSAELNPAGPITINTPGQLYQVTPRITVENV